MMKRTTIISIGFTLVTVLTIILMITHLIFNIPNAEKTLLGSKEKIELPACTTIQFDYTTNAVKGKEPLYLLSDIAIMPDSTGTGNHLSASPALLDKITTSVKGNVLTIHFDLSNPDLWKKYRSMYNINKRKKPLITIALAPEVMSLTNEQIQTKHRVIYHVTNMKRAGFEIDLSKNNLILENSNFKQLTIANPGEINLNKLTIHNMTLIDNQTNGMQHLWDKDCVVDTLEIRNTNRLYMSNFAAPKHIRWIPLSDDASLDLKLKSNQTFEKL